MKYVIDSYAWIEYFMGTEAGEKAKPIIESTEEKITPTKMRKSVTAHERMYQSQIIQGLSGLDHIIPMSFS